MCRVRKCSLWKEVFMPPFGNLYGMKVEPIGNSFSHYVSSLPENAV